MVLVKFDPTREFYKNIVGAVPQDEKFTLRLQINECMQPSKVFVVVYSEDTDFHQEYELYKDMNGAGFDNYLVSFTMKKGLYWYYFRMEGVPYEHFVGINDNLEACLYYEGVRPWQLSVYHKKYETPTWLNNGIMYQIMVDRFCQQGTVIPTEDKIMRRWGEQPYYEEPDGSVTNRDFFGGTLKGVIKQLPYLRSLNVRTIYLNPIFKAYSNHKYDTEDYEIVDSMFGTNEDFKSLCEKADKLGINIILDGVFNHVGVDSKYFNRGKKYGEGGAYNDPKSPYRDWFTFHNNGKSYDCWWNFETLPRINAKSKGAQEYFCGKNGIVPLWLKRGASGWRLDVVDEIEDCMLDEIVRSAKEQDPQCAIIGEVWEDASNKMDYGVRRRYFDGSQLDSVMNYPLKDAIISFVRDRDAHAMKSAIFMILNNYPRFVRNNLMNILCTHDTVRILTTLAGDRVENSSKHVMSKRRLNEGQYRYGIELLKMCAVLQYTIFGFPCVFYGDEVAMEGYKDPFCRGCYPWGKENKLLLDFYRRLGELRDMVVFREGNFNLQYCKNSVVAFERSNLNSGEKVLIAVNRSHETFHLNMNGVYEDLLTGRIYRDGMDLLPDQYVVAKKVASM